MAHTGVLGKLESDSMDMWDASIGGVRESIPLLARSSLKIARAWRIKEAAGELLRAKSHEEAARDWKKLLSWITRSRLEPVVKVARTIRQYLRGIVNATRLGATNAKSESANAMIQKLKARACGFRNHSRFKMAILFHLGGLSLLPDGLT